MYNFSFFIFWLRGRLCVGSQNDVSFALNVVEHPESIYQLLHNIVKTISNRIQQIFNSIYLSFIKCSTRPRLCVFNTKANRSKPKSFIKSYRCRPTERPNRSLFGQHREDMKNARGVFSSRCETTCTYVHQKTVNVL